VIALREVFIDLGVEGSSVNQPGRLLLDRRRSTFFF